jgi:hypothetical protein
MEYKYKIVSNDSMKIVNLASLSTSLKIGSEIYSVENNKEILLGFISHKALVYIAAEAANYSLQHYAKKKIPEAETCIDLAKKWIEDTSSVSNKEIKAAADDAGIAAYAAGAANALHAAAAYAEYAYYTAAYYTAAYYTANYYTAAANAAADAAGVNREEEFIRQGEFILDYLKSGLYLFHLEK